MAVNLSPVGGVAGQFFDNNGNPLTGGKLYTYAAGTTTNQATYTSASGTTAHTNPIVLDAGGRVPSGEIWLTDGVQYKFVLKNSSDVTIGTYDNIIGINSNFVNFVTETEIQTATSGQTVFTLATMQYQPGTNNLSVFVDGVNQYDGVSYSYVETDSTTVTFTAGLHVGAQVKFTTAQTLSTGVTDASLVTYDPPFTASVPTTVEDKLAQTISVKDFGAVGDDATDDTSAIQDAIDAAVAGKQSLYIPAGTYKITASLTISDEVVIYGDGNQQSILKLYTSSSSTFAIVCDLPDNSSAIGLNIGNIGITGDGGAADGGGIYLATTATNSAISQSSIHDMYIRNVTTGVSLNGVVYMCDFSRITVTGVASYGWKSVPIAGQIIYNSFNNLEVTGVASSAYAYYMEAPSCHFNNLTADGCADFTGAYICVDGYALEGIYAATAASTYAIKFTQVMSVRNVDIINVPTAKCAYGLSIESPNFVLSGVRVPDSGAGNQPANILNLYTGNNGTISGIQCDRAVTNKLESYLSDAILNGFVFTSCEDVTNRGLSYAQGTWTPTFPTNWSTSPSVISAQYTKIGRQVTVTLYATDGVCTAGAVIGGLPYAANATQGAGAAGGNSDSTESISGSITPSATSISNIPARTLTGNYWQITATYFA